MNTAQTESSIGKYVAVRAKQYIDTFVTSQKLLEESRAECNRLRAESARRGNSGGENHVERLAMQMAEQIAEKRVQEAARSVHSLVKTSSKRPRMAAPMAT